MAYTPNPTAETLLVRREGNEIVFLNVLRHRKDPPLTLRFPISQLNLPASMVVRGQEGIVEGLDYRGVPVLAAVRRIPDSPWFLIAKVDTKEVYTPVRDRARTVIILVTLLIGGAGLILGFLWFRQRARSYKKLYEAELERQALVQRLDYLSKYANDIILLADKDLKIIEANDRAVSSYGYTRGELLHLNLRQLRPPDLRLTLDAQTKQIDQSHGLVYETIHQRKDGTTFPVEVSARSFEVGGKQFYQDIVRDVTDRKEIEEALRVTHHFLEIANRHMEMPPLLKECVAEVKKLTDHSAVGIRILDNKGKIPYQAYEGFSQEFYELESPLSIESDPCMCINVVKGAIDSKLPHCTDGGSFYVNGTTRFLATVSKEEKGQMPNVCNQHGFESMALVPIRAEGRILGLIQVADPKENRIPLGMVETLEKVAMQLGTALRRVQAEAVLHRQREELAIHASILSTLLETVDLDERLNIILDQVLAFLKIEFGLIYLVKKNELVLHCWKGIADGLPCSSALIPH